MIHDELIGEGGTSYAGKPTAELPDGLRREVLRRYLQLEVGRAKGAAKSAPREAAAEGKRGYRYSAEGEGKGRPTVGLRLPPRRKGEQGVRVRDLPSNQRGQHVLVSAEELTPSELEHPDFAQRRLENGLFQVPASWLRPETRVDTLPAEPRTAHTQASDLLVVPAQQNQATAKPPGVTFANPADAKTEQGLVPQAAPQIVPHPVPENQLPRVQPVKSAEGIHTPQANFIPPQAIINQSLRTAGTADPAVLAALHRQSLQGYANWWKGQDLSGTPMPQVGEQIPITRDALVQAPTPRAVTQNSGFGDGLPTYQQMQDRIDELNNARKRELAGQEQGTAGGPLQRALAQAFQGGLRQPMAPPLPAAPPPPEESAGADEGAQEPRPKKRAGVRRRAPFELIPSGGGYRIGPEHKMPAAYQRSESDEEA